MCALVFIAIYKTGHHNATMSIEVQFYLNMRKKQMTGSEGLVEEQTDRASTVAQQANPVHGVGIL